MSPRGRRRLCFSLGSVAAAVPVIAAPALATVATPPPHTAPRRRTKIRFTAAAAAMATGDGGGIVGGVKQLCSEFSPRPSARPPTVTYGIRVFAVAGPQSAAADERTMPVEEHRPAE